MEANELERHKMKRISYERIRARIRDNQLYPNMSAWRGLRPWKRHSLVLMVAGLAFVLMGFVNMFIPPSPARAQALAVALKWAPMEFWGGVFVFAGILTIISSRWPPISKTWGYMVLTGLSAGWGATYAAGIVVAHAPLSNISQTFMWELIAFLWWAISGLYNLDDARLRAHGPG